MTDFEFYSLAVAIASSLLIFAGLIYTGRQLELSRKFAIDDHEWRRRIEAQKAVASFSGLAEMRQRLDAKLGYVEASEPLSLEFIDKAFEDDPSLRSICHD